MAEVVSTNQFRNGMHIELEGQTWRIVEFQHVKPGKGGAFVRTKLKAVLSGKVVDKTFNAGTKVETSNVDKRTMQYLYKDGTDFVFMDGDTFDQMHVSEAFAGIDDPGPLQAGDAAFLRADRLRPDLVPRQVGEHARERMSERHRDL